MTYQEFRGKFNTTVQILLGNVTISRPGVPSQSEARFGAVYFHTLIQTECNVGLRKALIVYFVYFRLAIKRRRYYTTKR